jgi:hypothetical protein
MARRKYQISLECLPQLIAEIDSRTYKPSPKQRASIIERFRDVEYIEQTGTDARRLGAANMVNDYLIDVLWRTRKFRDGSWTPPKKQVNKSDHWLASWRKKGGAK